MRLLCVSTYHKGKTAIKIRLFDALVKDQDASDEDRCLNVAKDQFYWPQY